jgi:hypothetical protein
VWGHRGGAHFSLNNDKMKKTLILPAMAALSAFVLTNAGASAVAGQPKHGATKAFHAVKEDTISAVSSTSITIVHTRYKKVKGKPQETTVTKTYQITPLTTIEVNGAEASADDLHNGMAVAVSADAPTSLDESDPDDGGVARNIAAH